MKSLLIVFICLSTISIFIASLYYIDYRNMQKANREYLFLKTTFPVGMNREKVNEKMHALGYKKNDFEMNTNEYIIYFKSLQWPPPLIQKIAYVTGVPIALSYPTSIKLHFSSDEKINLFE